MRRPRPTCERVAFMVNNTVRLLGEIEKAAAFGRDSVKAVLKHVDNTELRRALEAITVETLTPIEALNQLYQLKQLL